MFNDLCDRRTEFFLRKEWRITFVRERSKLMVTKMHFIKIVYILFIYYVHVDAFGKFACVATVAAFEENLLNCVNLVSCFSNGIHSCYIRLFFLLSAAPFGSPE